MSAYQSSMSTGTRLMLTAVGLVGVCQQKQSGRWLRVQSPRRMVGGLSRHKRRYPWGDELPTLERANLDWQRDGMHPG